MKRKENLLILRVAEGIGNQLFMYANAFSLSKKYNYKLLIDDTSGYFKKKNQIRSYELNKFINNLNIASDKLKFDTYLKDLKRKFLKKIDPFFPRKNFYVEKKNYLKKTFFQEINLINYSNIIFLEGHFESEKYFKDYSEDIKKFIKPDINLLIKNNKYINNLVSSNSVSICIRQNRYSEGKFKDANKSSKFTKDTIDYIYRAVDFAKKKVSNPKFFIWSNDFKNLREYFNEDEYTFIENEENKSINDFNLFNYSKHFIVGPTSFHWWGAWLNENPNKICIRPSNINPSKNENLWPNEWISI